MVKDLMDIGDIVGAEGWMKVEGWVIGFICHVIFIVQLCTVAVQCCGACLIGDNIWSSFIFYLIIRCYLVCLLFIICICMCFVEFVGAGMQGKRGCGPLLWPW